MAYENTQIASNSLVEGFETDAFPNSNGVVTQAILESVAAAEPSRNAYYVDGETLRTVAEFRAGLTDRFEIGVELPLLMHTPGFMDQPIESFHEQLGLPDGERPAFAQDQYVIGYSDDGQTLFLEDSPSGVRPGDLVLSARTELYASRERGSALAAALAMKLPTGDEDRLDGSGHVDFSVSLAGSWQFGKSALHAGFQYLFPRSFSFAPDLDLRDQQSFFLTYGYRVRPAAAIVLQARGLYGLFPDRTGGSLGSLSIELAAGMRHSVGAEWTFEWALLENVTPDLNVPDVGLFVGFACRPGPRSVTPVASLSR